MSIISVYRPLQSGKITVAVECKGDRALHPASLTTGKKKHVARQPQATHYSARGET